MFFFNFYRDSKGCFLSHQAAMTNDDDFQQFFSDLKRHIFLVSAFTLITRFFLTDHKITFLSHLNVRSLTKKFSSLRKVLEIFPNPPKITCISETWLKADLIKNLPIPDYTFHRSPATVTNASGVAMYISNKFHFETTQDYNIENADCENFWIKPLNLKNTINYIVGVAFRHPASKHDDKIAKSNQTFFLLGDFNINTTPTATNSVDKLINMLLSNNCYPLITIPSRVTNTSYAIVDNIITNEPKLLLPVVIQTYFSDHYLVFSLTIYHCKHKSNPETIFRRDKSTFNPKALCIKFEKYL